MLLPQGGTGKDLDDSRSGNDVHRGMVDVNGGNAKSYREHVEEGEGGHKLRRELVAQHSGFLEGHKCLVEVDMQMAVEVVGVRVRREGCGPWQTAAGDKLPNRLEEDGGEGIGWRVNCHLSLQHLGVPMSRALT